MPKPPAATAAGAFPPASHHPGHAPDPCRHAAVHTGGGARTVHLRRPVGLTVPGAAAPWAGASGGKREAPAVMPPRRGHAARRPDAGVTTDHDARSVHSVYVGTYQPAGRDGLFHLRFDPRAGRLSVQSAVSSVTNPSFLALHPSGRYLYAVAEAPGGAEGEVWAFSLDERTGDLAPLNRRRAHGRSTCHVSVDATGRWVVVANYGSPTVVMYPVEAGGGLGEAVVVLRHQGASVHPRQTEPHPHSANIDPTNRFVYCPDLGLDKVMIYRLDAAAGTLVAGDPDCAPTAPGAGPRHLDFHPALPYAYVVNEIDCTVAAYARDQATGALRELQVVPALPAGFRGENTCADIHVHPSGRFLYASNRGHDSIAIYRIDAASGRLQPVGHAPTQGRTPRNFALDPSGSFLFAENQDSDSIVTFRVDPETGALQPTGERIHLPTPVCMKFRPDWTTGAQASQPPRV